MWGRRHKAGTNISHFWKKIENVHLLGRPDTCRKVPSLARSVQLASWRLINSRRRNLIYLHIDWNVFNYSFAKQDITQTSNDAKRRVENSLEALGGRWPVGQLPVPEEGGSDDTQLKMRCVPMCVCFHFFFCC